MNLIYISKLAKCYQKQWNMDLTYQDMPHVLIGSFKAAETDTSTQQTLTPPHVTGCYLQLPHPLGFRVVHFKFDRFFHISFQEVFQQVTFFILQKQKCWTSQLWQLRKDKTNFMPNNMKCDYSCRLYGYFFLWRCHTGLMWKFYFEERKKIVCHVEFAVTP